MTFAKPKPDSRKRKPQNTEFVDCPLCENNVLVYCWSWHNGKKCPYCTVVFRPKNFYNRWKYPELKYVSIQKDYEMRGEELPDVKGIKRN
jgi:hypothetical protein